MVYSGCQWGILVALAKLGTPELVGQYALALAITAPVVMLLNLQLRAVQATDAKFAYRFGDYLALRIVTTALALIVMIGIAVFYGGGITIALTIAAIGATKGAESLSDIYYGLMQLHERMDRIAISSIIKGPLCLIALTAGVWLTHTVHWGATGMAAGLVLVLVFYDIPKAADIMRSPMTPIWEWNIITNLTRLAAPLGITMMLISLNTNIPRYFIAKCSGERELGIFAAMAYLLVVGNMVLGALADSASPRLAKYYAAGDAKSFSNLLAKLVGVGTFAGLSVVALSICAGKWVLSTLYGPEYAQYPTIFTWLAIASAVAFIQWFLGNGMTAARCFKVQVLLLGSNTIITLLACALLIPRYGLLGAAISLVIANVSLALGTLWVVLAATKRI